MKYYSQPELSRLFNESFRFEALDDYIQASTDPDLVEFLHYLKRPNAGIFTGWIEQWKEVYEIISKGETSIPFSDKFKLKEHTLFSSFQNFVTPFLFPPLNQQAGRGILNETLEYIVLLETDSRVIVEYAVHTKIEQLFSNIHQLQEQKNTTEGQLVEVVHDVVNEQIINILNAFSKRSYVHVIAYVENCFKILESRGCTLRVANWIVKQMQQLRLNPEHIQQLSDFQNDLKTGVFRVESKGKKQNKIRLRSLISIAGLLTFAGLITWLVIFKPWSEQVAPKEQETASSFTEFTVEERRHIDSLLKIIQPEPVLNLEVNDPYIEGRELMVDARKAIVNRVVNAFYEAWEEYLAADTVRSETVCKNLSKTITASSLPEGFSKLSDKKNGKPAFFRNESGYTVQIIVFNNNPGDKPYYHELKRDEQVEFNLSTGEHIGIVAGKHSIPYQSVIESIVFCEFDNVTYGSLITTYVLKQANSYNYKFLISGEDTYDFQLIDMYGVLESY